jgi:uncharacterized protein YecE (DUF72 family)
LIHVVDPFERPSVVGAPAYYRLHGKSLGAFRYEYGYKYSDEELENLRQCCSTQPSYCLFNNKQMAADAKRFADMILNCNVTQMGQNQPQSTQSSRSTH